jgi:hypothetical protein
VGTHTHTHGMETSFVLLYIGIALLIAAIVGYVIASKINNANTSRLKKAEKTALKKKHKMAVLASHSGLAIAIILIGINLIQYSGEKTNIEKLNYQAEIQVTDDKDYGGGHSELPVKYEQKIPTSGTHSPHDIKYGFYKDKPSYELLVHNLEHGDVIIYFHPDANQEVKDQIEALTKFRKAGSGVLGVPNPDVSSKEEIVVTAWNKTMVLPIFDQAKVGTFIYNHIHKGPEEIPPEIRQGGGTM